MDHQDSEAGLSTLSSQHDLDAHETAPKLLRDFFKLLKGKDSEQSPEIIDFNDIELPGLRSIPEARIANAFDAFPKPPKGSKCKEWEGSPGFLEPSDITPETEPAKAKTSAFSFKQVPGLVIVPSLLPDYIQARLLGRLLHRDLSNSQHNTNLHLHYNITYPDDGRSLFNIPPGAVAFEPKDPSIHKPLKMQQVLEKKLRWMTLGGQYDWTNKVYPADPPPGFPEDIAKFINSLFPDMEAQAAIVNVYSPGDTLSMHRDVSEEVDRGLVSISLGCDCIFVIGVENSTTRDIQKLAIRLRSGDVLYMTGESRLAWHGVPKIIPDTCPKHLMFWPGSSYPEWEGWMENKRINLNVRQMREATKGGSKSRFTDDGLFQYLDFENVSVSSPINLGVVLGLMTTMD